MSEQVEERIRVLREALDEADQRRRAASAKVAEATEVETVITNERRAIYDELKSLGAFD